MPFRWMFPLLLVFLLLSAAPGLPGDARTSVDPVSPADDAAAYVEKAFLITASVKTYGEALVAVKKLAAATGLAIDLRHHLPDPRTALSLPPKVCRENGWEPPVYVPRGRWDDGAYLSIEHTSGYPETMTPGLFIVVAASGSPGDPRLDSTRKRLGRHAPGAYVKTGRVYLGCLH